MKSKFMVGLAIAALVCLSLAAVSLAADGQTNGTGKSHLGYTVGYNAQSDLSGSFEYQPEIGGSTVNIHCGGPGQDDYTSYRETTTANGLYPKTIFNATKCFDDNETRYFVHIEAIDRGEPGTSDSLCITVKLWPGRDNPTPLVKDCGIIQKGNVQIHTDATPVLTELVPTA
jgi:hypothetical protein